MIPLDPILTVVWTPPTPTFPLWGQLCTSCSIQLWRKGSRGVGLCLHTRAGLFGHVLVGKREKKEEGRQKHQLCSFCTRREEEISGLWRCWWSRIRNTSISADEAKSWWGKRTSGGTDVGEKEVIWVLTGRGLIKIEGKKLQEKFSYRLLPSKMMSIALQWWQSCFLPLPGIKEGDLSNPCPLSLTHFSWCLFSPLSFFFHFPFSFIFLFSSIFLFSFLFLFSSLSPFRRTFFLFPLLC